MGHALEGRARAAPPRSDPRMRHSAWLTRMNWPSRLTSAMPTGALSMVSRQRSSEVRQGVGTRSLYGQFHAIVLPAWRRDLGRTPAFARIGLGHGSGTTLGSVSESSPAIPGFDELGLDPGGREGRCATSGYESPSPIQAEAIPPLLAGQHVVGLAQTGTGKTAAFALPILSRIDLSQTIAAGAGPGAHARARAPGLRGVRRYAAHLKGLHVLPVYGGQGYGVQLSALRRGRARGRRYAGPGDGPPREGHPRPERAAVRRARRGRRDAQHGLRRGRRDHPRRHAGGQAAGALQRDDPAADPPDHQEVRTRRHRDHA